MTNVQAETVLELSHRFEAPRERVFDAWTNPDVLRRWWAAGETWETPLAEVDLRPGGRYRLSMRTDTGDVHTVGGEYKEVQRPERLAYTWTWEQGAEEAQVGTTDTLVVVEFLEDGDATLVKLTHSGFDGEEDKQRHAHGWQAVLANLGRRVFS